MATHTLAAVAVLLACAAAPVALASTVQLWNSCSPANYTAGSAYGASLSRVIGDVVAAAGRSRDGYATVVHPPAPYGLAVCYADAGPPEVCRLCLRMAAGNVTLACPSAASAAMMYNNCLLRYADPASAGGRELARPEPDMEQRFSFSNVDIDMTSIGEADRYSAALTRLTGLLAPAAAATDAGSNGRLLAAFGQMNITGEENLYGFVQCVAGLSPAGCRRCLRSLIASLPFSVKGGRAYSLTCYTRFEVVPFYLPPNTTRILVAPPPPPSSSTSSSLPPADSSSSRVGRDPASTLSAALGSHLRSATNKTRRSFPWQQLASTRSTRDTGMKPNRHEGQNLVLLLP